MGAVSSGCAGAAADAAGLDCEGESFVGCKISSAVFGIGLLFGFLSDSVTRRLVCPGGGRVRGGGLRELGGSLLSEFAAAPPFPVGFCGVEAM